MPLLLMIVLAAAVLDDAHLVTAAVGEHDIEADDTSSLRVTLASGIRLDAYPQLRQLAWQLPGVEDLSGKEALELYERNWRHVDVAGLTPDERAFLVSNGFHAPLQRAIRPNRRYAERTRAVLRRSTTLVAALLTWAARR